MRLILCILIPLILNGCTIDKEASGLSVDHVNIWLSNPVEAKEKLEQIGFTSIPDSLSQIHKGQGTTGKYFYFLNGYLEFIYVNNEEEFKLNAEKNDELDFLERANNQKNGYSPYSVALKMEKYNQEKIPFETIGYSQEWMGKKNRIYAAKNSKVKKEEPSVFVVYPEIEYENFENIDSLSRIPEEYSIWREFYKHKNGAEKISKIIIHTNELNDKSETIETLNQLENVKLIKGEEYLMELYFDDNRQNKFYDMRPELPLKIYL